MSCPRRRIRNPIEEVSFRAAPPSQLIRRDGLRRIGSAWYNDPEPGPVSRREQQSTMATPLETAAELPTPEWEVARLLPARGAWSEADYLDLDTNRRVEYSR